MASLARRPLPDQQFAIHEDAATDEVEMADDPDQRTEEVEAPSEDANAASGSGDGSEAEAEAEESSDDEAPPAQEVLDMEKLEQEIPGIRGKFRFIKRIGEGVFLPTACLHLRPRPRLQPEPCFQRAPPN